MKNINIFLDLEHSYKYILYYVTKLIKANKKGKFMNKQHVALSLSVGVLGGISVFLASNLLSSVGYLIWVGFIAWGLFLKTAEIIMH